MFKCFKSTKASITFIVTLLSSIQCLAEENYTPDWMNDFRINGFLSQAFIATDENNFLGSSEDGSFRYNSAGLSASYSFKNDLQMSVQGVYKQIGKLKPRGSRLDYAIADWRVFSNIDESIGVRAGRLKNPFGFYNETRDVAATRPSVLLPESIYVDYLQDIFHSSDSVGLYGHKDFSQGTFSFNSIYGQPNVTEHAIHAVLSVDTTGDLEDDRILLSSFTFEDSQGLYRIALSGGKMKGTYKPGASDAVFVPDGLGGLIGLPIIEGELDLFQWLISAELILENWNFVGEFQRRNIRIDDIFTNIPLLGESITEKAMGYYLQAGYRFNHQVNAYLRVDHAFRFKNDKDGKKFAQEFAATGAIAHNTYAKDITVGINFKPTQNIDLGAEIHFIDGTFWLPDLENPEGFYPNKHWNMFLLQAAYRF